jgi:hypothetical protein
VLGLRHLIPSVVVLAAWLALAAPAGAFTGVGEVGLTAAQEQAPLEGTGENLELVANVPIDAAGTGVAASDLELHGNYAFVGSYGEGMVVVDIADPTKPKRVGKFACKGGQNDIQLSPDGKYVAMAIETRNNGCHPQDEGTSIIDVSDPANPREVAFINRQELPQGSHNNTLDWPYLYVNQYVTSYSQLEIFDLSTPSAPRKVGALSFNGEDSVHDLYVDHRPDGKTFAYAASMGFTDVIDVTNPAAPVLRERLQDPHVTISHQAEPNFDRRLLLVTDEYNGGAENTGACGGAPARVPVPTGIPQFGDPQNIGALHIYRLDAQGNIADSGGTDKAGTHNIPYAANEEPSAGCTIHVFWQAPDENRLVTAWYGQGTRIVDYSDPTEPKELGHFIPSGSDVWAAKPHRGYIFTGDILRGMDVLRYTGEGGARWPATAGPAEVQRARIQGATPPAPTGPDPAPSPTPTPPPSEPGSQPRTPSKVGRRAFTKHVRVPAVRGRKTTELVVSFYRAKKLATRVRLKVRDARVAKLTTQVAGLAGHYRYTIRHGDRGRIVGRGIVKVRRSATTRVALPPGQSLTCRVSAK